MTHAWLSLNSAEDPTRSRDSTTDSVSLHSLLRLPLAAPASPAAVAYLLAISLTTMLEAKLSEAALLKRLLDGMFPRISFSPLLPQSTRLAVKELVSDANFECNEEGIVSTRFISLPPHATRRD